MSNQRRCDLTHDLFLPTLLFMAMGGMTWAVRGCSGYGSTAGCIFAGVMWGAGWWYLSHDSREPQTRRYSSAWIVLAVTIGIGLSGARGWGQWPQFFHGRLLANDSKGEFVPISPYYGFIWMFVAGLPWAGLGACLLAWCGSLREMRIWDWMLRIALGVGGASLGRYLFDAYPQYFLPLYSSIESQYRDFEANPNLKRLINDNRNAIVHVGYYVGFLFFEVYRRDWKNVILILTVGVLNGIGWAMFQTWCWAPKIWKDGNFNWWRCWESSGGLSIGFAFGIAYFLVNRKMSDQEMVAIASRRSLQSPNIEWLIVFSGLVAYLGLFLDAQTDGWSRYSLCAFEIFGVLYYLTNRQKSLGPTLSAAQLAKRTIGTQSEWGTVAIAAANTIVLFLPKELASRYGLLLIAAISCCGCGLYWANRARFDDERKLSSTNRGDPNLERMGLYLGLEHDHLAGRGDLAALSLGKSGTDSLFHLGLAGDCVATVDHLEQSVKKVRSVMIHKMLAVPLLILLESFVMAEDIQITGELFTDPAWRHADLAELF